MKNLKGKTLFITGGSRGIGRAIALKAARDGANIVVAAKTTKEGRLPGTIFSVAREIEEAGGNALPVQTDIRNEDEISEAVDLAVTTFGGIDILINNASAISVTPTLNTQMKSFDLMFDVNVRGTFVVSQACLPHLLKTENPHILTLSPPLNMNSKWFKDHLAYTMAKYGMSMCVLGMAAEFSGKVAVNALWPKTVIATDALKMLGGLVRPEQCRLPDIVADAAHAILIRDAKINTGNFYIDEEVLIESGRTDFSQYAVDTKESLMKDLFLD